MSPELELTVRVLGAGLLGAAIGYERELRGKGAGVRTHLLVAMGASLFMIISQYGFDGVIKFDAARIAAAVVGGLGFLGGGIIMKNKHVSGLTTAAGLWVTGAVGLGFGCGMYEMSVLCFLIIIACMEAMHFYNFRMGDQQIDITVTGRDRNRIIDSIKGIGKQCRINSIVKVAEGFKINASLLVEKRDFPHNILQQLDAIPGITLDSIE